jgi:RNA polymerase-associated protein
LYCAADDPQSHRVRLVAAEKNLSLELVDLPGSAGLAAIADIATDASLPALVERDLTLFDARIIIEFLDERFPHPPLMPIDPVTRGQFRLAMHRVERDWYPAARAIATCPEKRDLPPLREALKNLIAESAELFRIKPYFLSDEFSLVDASIAPILWRLPSYEIDLSGAALQPLVKYAQQLFSRPSFQRSLQDPRQLR